MGSLLTFSNVPNLITCEQATISWTYLGNTTDSVPTYNITILGDVADDATIGQTIAVVSNTTTVLSWSQVSVPLGIYQIHAVANGSEGTLDNPSNTFQVFGGVDLSCIRSTESSAKSTSAGDFSPATGTVTSSFNEGSSQIVSATTAESIATSSPIPSAEATPGLTHAAIVGIAIGATAFLSAIFLLFMCLRQRNIQNRSVKNEGIAILERHLKSPLKFDITLPPLTPFYETPLPVPEKNDNLKDSPPSLYYDSMRAPTLSRNENEVVPLPSSPPSYHA